MIAKQRPAPLVTRTLTINPDDPGAQAIAEAAACLRAGGLVAFPTETVYGLGVSALDAAAVRRLFEAKGRPADDPLIVHVATVRAIAPLVTRVPPVVDSLAARFWPGPLTIVLPRSAIVPDEVTAGLDTVAIRVPAHPIAQALLRAADIPVAAPSANLFSRPSPTRAAHVLEDLDGRIDLLLDGGSTQVGVESTVLDLSGELPTVLRPGAVTIEMLQPILGQVRTRSQHADAAGPMRSPGLLARHYSPRAPLTLFDGPRDRALERIAHAALAAQQAGRRVGVLLPDDDPLDLPDAVRPMLGSANDPGAIAARLYAALRELDAAGVDEILARALPEAGDLGPAIGDRLRRAAAGRVVRCDG
jgi:L-threonylcarbamoyladenylate synthase